LRIKPMFNLLKIQLIASAQNCAYLYSAQNCAQHPFLVVENTATKLNTYLQYSTLASCAIERGNFMSYVRKAKKGYYGYASYQDNEGKWHQKSAGCFNLKREALQAANKLEAELDQVNLDLKDMTLAKYYWRWYELYEENGITDVTKNRYKVIRKTIENYWKDTRLRDIKRSDYQAFINWYGANHARDSVNKLNNAIRSCVGYAIDDDIISKDFTHNVKVVANKERERKVEYLSHDELVTLKNEVKKKLNHYNTSRYMILTAIYTGMRKSEIQALTWKDIDFYIQQLAFLSRRTKRKKLSNQLKPNLASERLRLTVNY